jgi:hypothetical protein
MGLASVESSMEPYAKDSFLMRLNDQVEPRSVHLTSAAPIACDWPRGGIIRCLPATLGEIMHTTEAPKRSQPTTLHDG